MSHSIDHLGKGFDLLRQLETNNITNPKEPMTELKPGQEVWISVTAERPNPGLSGTAWLMRVHNNIQNNHQGDGDWYFSLSADNISTTPPMSEEDAEIVRAAEAYAHVVGCDESLRAAIDGRLGGIIEDLLECVDAKPKAQQPQTAEEALASAMTYLVGGVTAVDEKQTIIANLKAAGWELKRS